MGDSPEIAAYIRVSTQKQKDEDSHIRQRETIEDWADREDYDPDTIDWYEDIAISGQSDEREDYDELLEKHDEYDIIVVRELSRFGRNPERVTQDVLEIGEAGTEFVSVTEPMFDTTSAHGKLVMRNMAAYNGFYADLKREQAQMMIEKRREQGLPIGRPKKLDDQQLQEVYEWREKGLSYSHIATLVQEVHGVEVNRSTIYRYCTEAEEAT